MIVRPHHSLCMQFFAGEGYDRHFITCTGRLLEELSRNDPIVTLYTSCDVFCRACPNNRGGICADNDKVLGIDRRTLDALGLSEGSQLKWSELLTLARKNIIRTPKMQTICTDCQWSGICFSTSEYA